YRDKKRGVSFRPKHGRNRTVPLSPITKQLLESRSSRRRNDDPTEAVFAHPKTGRPRDRKTVSDTVSKFVRDAGLNVKRPVPALRHTSGSWLASSGVPLVKMQRWMGHASITQTQVYADLLPDALDWQESSYHEAAGDLPKETFGVDLG